MFISCKTRILQSVPRTFPSCFLAIHACRILAIALEARSAIWPMNTRLYRYASTMHGWRRGICTYLDLTLSAGLASCRGASSIRHFVLGALVTAFYLAISRFSSAADVEYLNHLLTQASGRILFHRSIAGRHCRGIESGIFNVIEGSPREILCSGAGDEALQCSSYFGHNCLAREERFYRCSAISGARGGPKRTPERCSKSEQATISGDFDPARSRLHTSFIEPFSKPYKTSYESNAETMTQNSALPPIIWLTACLLQAQRLPMLMIF